MLKTGHDYFTGAVSRPVSDGADGTEAGSVTLPRADRAKSPAAAITSDSGSK